MKPIKWILLVAVIGLIFGLIMASGTAEGQGFRISGHKWDGSYDYPVGLEDWAIWLKYPNGTVKQTATNKDGAYEFDNLPPGSYEVYEGLKDNWKHVSPRRIAVTLVNEDLTFINFINVPTKNATCGTGCPWYIKNELYRAQCGELLEVPASSGILANDLKGTTVIDPELITIDPKYGTLEVYEDGSFDYDPDPSIPSGTYVVFYYTATNGACEAANKGLAKIQVACRR